MWCVNHGCVRPRRRDVLYVWVLVQLVSLGFMVDRKCEVCWGYLSIGLEKYWWLSRSVTSLERDDLDNREAYPLSRLVKASVVLYIGWI